MPKIKLAEPWTYRTPLATIEYPAGEHEVTEEIAALAPNALPADTKPKESANGDGTATPGAKIGTGKAKG